MLIPVVLAAALMQAAMAAASAVSAILIADDLGPALAGLPNTAGVLGTAAGAMLLGRWTARLSRAQALRIGYGVGVAGGACTVLAAVGGGSARVRKPGPRRLHADLVRLVLTSVLQTENAGSIPAVRSTMIWRQSFANTETLGLCGRLYRVPDNRCFRSSTG